MEKTSIERWKNGSVAGGRMSMNSVWDEIAISASRAWPTVVVPRERFVAYLTARVPEDVDHGEALRCMHTSDLYLACACADGDLNALKAFEAHFLPVVDRALPRLGLDPDARAEVKQRLRSTLLIDGRGPARITRFQGRGDLRSWIRVMAVREGLAILRRLRGQAPIGDDQLIAAVAAGDSPEVAYLKRKYRHEFRLAFTDALQSLSDRDRLVLRQRFLDGLDVIAIARGHRVHRGTAASWLERARARVLAATRASLVGRLQVAPTEIDSILRLISSQLEVSLRLLLRRKT
jgi:RNA polymerase sigma-70 factor (ECF subfamily)